MDQTLDLPRELRTVTFTREYAFPMKRLAWWTLAITAVMGALYFLVGFPPAFDTYYQKMYFHAIGIGIAALAAYLVLDVFGLEAFEPALDFPIRYRAFISVVFGALGGLVYLNRDVFASLPDIGVLFLFVAFVLIFDVGAALLVELIVMPRKKAGIYDNRSRSIVDYVSRLIPFTAADRAAYRGVGSAYWLAVVSIASICLAMIIGFMNLWVRAFGPSIFGGYMNWLGLNVYGFEAATLDPRVVQRLGLTFTADSSSFIVTDQHTGVLVRWDARSWRRVENLAALGSNHWAVALSPDERWLATGDCPARVTVWDWTTRQAVTNFPVSIEVFGVLRFSHSGHYLIALTLSNGLKISKRVWGVGSGVEVSLTGGQFDGLWGMVDVSPDDRLLAAGFANGAVKLFHLPSLELVKELGHHK